MGILVALVVGLASFHIWASKDATDWSLDNECQPSGLAATVRASYQGARFWRHQAAAANFEIEWLSNEEARIQERKADLDRMLENHRKELKKFQDQAPSLRPSPEDEAAEALRRRAAELEEQAEAIEREQGRKLILQWLERCQTIAAQHAEGA